MNSISSQVATVDYLQLLTIQLQNQDPIDPVDQEGLIQDLTQFAQLEGLESLNASFADVLKVQELTQGISLVGKSVSFTDPASGDLKSGTASEVLPAGDTVNVIVDGQTVALENIVSVSSS